MAATASVNAIPPALVMKIEPCIVVRDTLTVERAVRYDRRNHTVTNNPDGSEDATWEGKRHYKNRQEAQQADRIYAQARSKLRSVCLRTDLGFICPESKKAELDQAIEAARKVVEDANAGFQYCHVNFRVVLLELKPANEDGVAILRESLERTTKAVQEALADFDVKKARTLLATTKQFMDVLADPASKQALITVREEARKVAAEVANVVKQFDGNVQNALASQEGAVVLARAKAAWNF